MSRHFEHNINPGAIGPLHHNGAHIVFCRIQHVIGVHPARDLRRCSFRSMAKTVVAPTLWPRQSKTGRWGPARDGDSLPRDVSRQNSVHRVTERVEDGGIVLRDRQIQLPDVGLGNHHVLCKRAIGIDADDPHVLADVRFAGSSTALAARRAMGAFSTRV